jgi:transcriptional regulator with XRE-family HTH domain
LVEQLRERIGKSGLNLKELGEAAGVDPSQLSRFMRAERSLTLPVVEKLCAALGLRLTRDPNAPGRG